VRDALTARGLRRHGVAALAPGNPMMDDLEPAPLPARLRARRRLLLLAGSRMPEALRNAERLLSALTQLPAGPAITVLVATGREPNSAQLAPLLQRQGFAVQRAEPASPGLEPDAAPATIWRRGPVELWVGPGCFAAWAGWAEVGLANAGTATEQLTGLGIPALSLPGDGPQFKAGFARRQSRLLGGAVVPCRDAGQLAQRLHVLLENVEFRRQLGRQGQRHMGPAGVSAAIAALIEARLLSAG